MIPSITALFSKSSHKKIYPLSITEDSFLNPPFKMDKQTQSVVEELRYKK